MHASVFAAVFALWRANTRPVAQIHTARARAHTRSRNDGVARKAAGHGARLSSRRVEILRAAAALAQRWLAQRRRSRSAGSRSGGDSCAALPHAATTIARGIVAPGARRQPRAACAAVTRPREHKSTVVRMGRGACGVLALGGPRMASARAARVWVGSAPARSSVALQLGRRWIRRKPDSPALRRQTRRGLIRGCRAGWRGCARRGMAWVW